MKASRSVITAMAVLLALPALTYAQHAPRPVYRDSTAAIDARVRDLLGRMTPDEKFWQLYMAPAELGDSTHYAEGVFGLQMRLPPTATPVTPGVLARAQAQRFNQMQRYLVEHTRLGIPMIPFEEAVHGLLADGATVFPQAIGLAATWDTALMGHVAAAIAAETRSRGIRDVLSPVINIASDVRWGRVEETYGEDPYLSSQMARAFVGAFAHDGVITTPKHFVANIGDGGRDSYPVDIDERLLREIYFPPFQAAIDAGALSMMTAYNSVNGSPASQNRWLLTDVLKDRWSFTGFVISDESAVGGATVLHHTEATSATAAADAFNAGLDVIFESGWRQARGYVRAVHDGLVSPAVLDSAVARVLRVKFRLGLFEHPYVNPDSAAPVNGSDAHLALARDAARASIVLLKNDGALPLPLDSSAVTPASLLAPLTSVAVIGVDAVEARRGGYAGPGVKNLSILDGVRDRVGPNTVVRYAPGPGREATGLTVVPTAQLASVDSGREVQGLKGEYFDNIDLSGEPKIVRTDPKVEFSWTLNSPGRGIPFDWYSARWTGSITAPATAVQLLGVQGNDGYRLYLDGKLLIDNWRKESFHTRTAKVLLVPGSVHQVRLEFFESVGNARLRLVWDAGAGDAWKATIDSAVSIAAASDVAIVVPGLEEGEFRDRAFLNLPGRQDQLIAAVAGTGTPTVVVLVGGSAVTMYRWLDGVDAVLDAWYPGDEGGAAVADVLFGDYNPAGRLPITFPIAEGQLPLTYNHKPTGRGDDYLDLTGQPLFPFGFGLSYTTFEYSDLAITPDTMKAAGSATVRCTVKNTGTKAGDEVVQLYVHDILASVAQPVIALKGFERVHLEPGESRVVTFPLGPTALRLLDANLHWVVEPGDFRVLVGSSSKDIRLRGTLTVQ